MPSVGFLPFRTIVTKIVAGSSAAHDGRLKVGDHVIDVEGLEKERLGNPGAVQAAMYGP